ncbi:MAG: glucose-6-phosphate isomerase [Gammaproteobacteria bacterium]|nr:glucose-6-phosphate isomerase [Gammaproteobacteria bacterium]
MTTTPKPQDLPAWKRLTRMAEQSIQSRLSEISETTGGFEHSSHRLTLGNHELMLDLSKQRLDQKTLATLVQLANERGFEGQRKLLFDGAQINTSEHRSALHTALRAPFAERPALVRDTVEETLQRFGRFADAVRTGARRGFTGKSFSDIVHIGIGGSYLGPRLVVDALHAQYPESLRFHFLANIDGAAIDRCLAGLNPETTLIILASKSFTTLETRVNGTSARSWFLERTTDEKAVAEHFVAVTGNIDAARAFGISDDFLFPVWDWVGGRFSLWSAVGLPIAMAIGAAGFQELLNGANAMDRHFLNAPIENNLPALLALTDVWNYNFLGVNNHAILPYDHRLSRLPDYLQQLQMESNGKSVHVDGTPVGIHTMPVIWGGEGTNGQHAFHQLMHQGTRSFTADFILIANADHKHDTHQRWLLASALGQSQAMMIGEQSELSHRTVAGDHATTTLVLDQLTPFTLGALLAMYEHKVFCQGVIWNINSFDQWGVELGKQLAEPVFEQLGGNSTLGQETSTKGLIDYLKDQKRSE